MLMETMTKTMQVTVPASDATFLRHLSGKMGWSLRNVRATQTQKNEVDDAYFESPQFYQDLDAAEQDIEAGKGVSVRGIEELNALLA